MSRGRRGKTEMEKTLEEIPRFRTREKKEKNKNTFKKGKIIFCLLAQRELQSLTASLQRFK